LLGSTHTLSIAVTGSGAVSRNPSLIAYPNGSVVTLTATPESGWMFTAWSGSAVDTLNPLNLTMDADKEITATFAPIPVYALTVEVSGQGSVTPAGGNYLSNALVTLTATPEAGWVFGQRTGAVSATTNPVIFPLQADQRVTAIFGQPPSISSQPQGAAVALGGSLQLSVEAQGSGPLTYQWQRDGLRLKDETSATLELVSIGTADAGEVPCSGQQRLW